MLREISLSSLPDILLFAYPGFPTLVPDIVPISTIPTLQQLWRSFDGGTGRIGRRSGLIHS